MSQQAPHADTYTPRGSYITRHWRGDLSLAKSYWINGVVIAIVGRVLWFGTIAGLAVGVRDRGTLVASLYGLILVYLIVYIWQTVGIWRSAGRHVSRGGRRVWAILAQVACVLGVIYFGALTFQNLQVANSIATNERYWLDPRARR